MMTCDRGTVPLKELSNTGPRGSGGVVEALGSRHICS